MNLWSGFSSYYINCVGIIIIFLQISGYVIAIRIHCVIELFENCYIWMIKWAPAMLISSEITSFQFRAQTTKVWNIECYIWGRNFLYAFNANHHYKSYSVTYKNGVNDKQIWILEWNTNLYFTPILKISN